MCPGCTNYQTVHSKAIVREREKTEKKTERGGEDRNWFLLKREGSEYANAAMNKIVATSTLYGSS
jgi:hypothetical protein